jgi:sugar phosphate isomerase/epimerase
MLSLGLCSVTFRALSFERVLDLAAEAGVAGIEWGGDVHVPPGDLSRAAEVREASASRGIAVASYGSYVEAGVTSDAEFAAVLSTAAAVGAPNIRVWAGKRGVAPADVSTFEYSRAAGDLSRFARGAAASGITLSLEFHRETLTDTLEATLRLLDDVADPNLFTYWQPRYWVRSRDPLREALGELRALRARLSHIHVFNWKRDRERLPLREARALWEPLLAEVSGWGDRERYAMLEFVRDDDPAVFLEDTAALREWLRRSSPSAG